MARSAVSLAALYSLLRPPRAPLAACMIFFFRAWWATPFLTRGMVGPYAWRRRLTRGKSAELTRSPFLSRFFRFRDFFVRMCEWLACHRFSFPDPVVLKRFMAARLVFCLGIVFLVAAHSGRTALLRRDHHRHIAALELGLGLDLSYIGEGGRHPIEDRLAQLQMGHLPPPEHHGHLDLV